MHAVGRGVRRAAGNVAQAQLRGSCRPALVRAAAQRCNPVQHLLKQPIATHLHLHNELSQQAQYIEPRVAPKPLLSPHCYKPDLSSVLCTLTGNRDFGRIPVILP